MRCEKAEKAAKRQREQYSTSVLANTRRRSIYNLGFLLVEQCCLATLNISSEQCGKLKGWRWEGCCLVKSFQWLYVVVSPQFPPRFIQMGRELERWKHVQRRTMPNGFWRLQVGWWVTKTAVKVWKPGSLVHDETSIKVLWRAIALCEDGNSIYYDKSNTHLLELLDNGWKEDQMFWAGLPDVLQQCGRELHREERESKEHIMMHCLASGISIDETQNKPSSHHYPYCVRSLHPTEHEPLGW